MPVGSVQLSLMMGPTIAVPVPAFVMRAFRDVEVTHTDGAASAFQINFEFGGDASLQLGLEALLALPIFDVFVRVVVTVTFKSLPHVLIDGIVLNKQVKPGSKEGTILLSLTGEDVSVMMDKDDVNAAHPMQPDMVIVNKLILKYAKYGMIPLVIPPTMMNIPLPTDPPPTQNTTDYQYLNQLADRYNYVFYVMPGPVPLTNIAYWGPQIRIGIPQKALTVNMGYATNVENLDFELDARKPTTYVGSIKDTLSGAQLPLLALFSAQIPLASLPTLTRHIQDVRRTQVRESGLDYMSAFAQYMSKVTESTNEVLVGTGSINVLKYNGILSPRGLVGVRGASLLYDGFFYVKSVTHTLRQGEYKQDFVIVREGLGTTTPVVRP
jgi:hypothetical protein